MVYSTQSAPFVHLLSSPLLASNSQLKSPGGRDLNHNPVFAKLFPSVHFEMLASLEHGCFRTAAESLSSAVAEELQGLQRTEHSCLGLTPQQGPGAGTCIGAEGEVAAVIVQPRGSE